MCAWTEKTATHIYTKHAFVHFIALLLFAMKSILNNDSGAESLFRYIQITTYFLMIYLEKYIFIVFLLVCVRFWGYIFILFIALDNSISQISFI